MRVTARCLKDDLDQAADATFEDLDGVEIIKTFKKDRLDRTTDTRQVSQLKSGKPVWVLSRGNDHRGGTWFDPAERIVWLLAYRLHRSQDPDDFFPYCRSLDDENGALWPDKDDYVAALRDRGSRFAWWVRIEAPLILKQAKENPGEHRVMFGGKYGACLAVEVADELQATTVAFRLDTVPPDHVPIILAALYGDAAWEPTDRMPSRELEALEQAFTHLSEEHPTP